jgi:predicted RNase H-like HicB family nuclease
MMDLEDYMALDYPVVVMASHYTDGSPSVTAIHPDIPGCRGQGDTEDEARADLVEARRALFEVLLDEGIDIPMPTVDIGKVSPIVISIGEPGPYERGTFSKIIPLKPISNIKKQKQVVT